MDAGPLVATGPTGASVEGFDLATGRTLWSVDAGANVALAQETAPPQIGQEVVILLNTAGTPMALNLTNGTEWMRPVRSPVPAGPTAFLPGDDQLHRARLRERSRRQQHHVHGWRRRIPLQPQRPGGGRPVESATFAGPSLDGLTAWSEANQVVAVAAG